jgi:ribosomal protein S18 acetylase RimI-like enzyme
VRQALEVANAVSSVRWPRPGEANRPADGAAPAATRAGQACAEVHTLVQMLQIMENAWLSLNLDVHYAHPLNRGWMDIFYRWTNTPLFRRHWPVLRSEFARGFVSFCEKQVHMGHVDVVCEDLPADRPLPDVLTREFEDERTEWGPGGLQQRRRDPWGQARCWLIHAQMADPGGRLGLPPKETPCGFVLVWHDLPGPERPDEPWRAYDFLIWVRGAYRNCGIGREAVFKILKKFYDQQWPAPPYRLVVRLPVGNLTGPGGSLLRAMWETFFHHLDFHPLYQPPSSPAGAEVAPSQEAILEREFGGAKREGAAPAAQGGG